MCLPDWHDDTLLGGGGGAVPGGWNQKEIMQQLAFRYYIQLYPMIIKAKYFSLKTSSPYLQ